MSRQECAAHGSRAECDTHWSRIDRAGTLCSAACAAHCASAALVPGVLAALGLPFLEGHAAEWGFTLVAVSLAAVASSYAWRRHRSAVVHGAFALGIVALLGSRFLEEAGVHGLGTMVGVCGALALVAGHVLNMRRASPAAAVASPPAG